MKIGITERGDAALDWAEWYPKRHSVDGVILITKDPRLLAERLPKNPDFRFIIHCTITGYGRTFLEPHVPHPDQSLEYYHILAAEFGPERVVLRVDPILPVSPFLELSHNIYGKKVQGGRARISFLDNYNHFQRRIKDVLLTDLSLQNYVPVVEQLLMTIATTYDSRSVLQKRYTNPANELHAPRELRKRIHSEFFSEAEVCGEPGMACSGCVSARDLSALGLDTPSVGKSSQRAACACMGIKTELLTRRGQCKHGCLYCYWR